jgi:hypothetical protein
MVQSEKVLAAVPFFKVKKDYLDLLKTKEDVISWTALFTGPFFDWVSLALRWVLIAY